MTVDFDDIFSRMTVIEPFQESDNQIIEDSINFGACKRVAIVINRGIRKEDGYDDATRYSRGARLMCAPRQRSRSSGSFRG